MFYWQHSARYRRGGKGAFDTPRMHADSQGTQVDDRMAEMRATGMGDDARLPAAARAANIASAGAEHRASPRFALLVRSAKLVADGRELVCVLRDASATGAKVRLFHPIPDDAQLALELADGGLHPAEIVWSAGDHAGLHFRHKIDVRCILDDRGDAYPKRQLRLRIDRPAMLNAAGADHAARLVNISQAGAGIECADRLMLRQPLRLEIDGLPTIHAHICWRRAPRYGLVFAHVFTLEELARLVAALQGLAMG